MNLDDIGKFIKELRIKNNLTQRQLADLLGVTYQAVSKWERGQSVPDIAILKDISDKFDININDILDGNKEKVQINKTKGFKWYLVILIIILAILVGLFYVRSRQSAFEFKTISTTCKEFQITGSAAYNKEKTSIYISNIEYCGKDNNTVYKRISCILFAGDEKITDCKPKNNITLEEYLKDLKMNIANHKTCKNIKNNKLRLEISAIGDDKLETSYKIPLHLDENC